MKIDDTIADTAICDITIIIMTIITTIILGKIPHSSPVEYSKTFLIRNYGRRDYKNVIMLFKS